MNQTTLYRIIGPTFVVGCMVDLAGRPTNCAPYLYHLLRDASLLHTNYHRALPFLAAQRGWECWRL